MRNRNYIQLTRKYGISIEMAPTKFNQGSIVLLMHFPIEIELHEQ